MEILKESIDTLTGKQKDYEFAMQDTDSNTLRLLYADSASVIQDCIDMVNETASKYGISIT